MPVLMLTALACAPDPVLAALVDGPPGPGL